MKKSRELKEIPKGVSVSSMGKYNKFPVKRLKEVVPKPIQKPIIELIQKPIIEPIDFSANKDINHLRKIPAQMKSTPISKPPIKSKVIQKKIHNKNFKVKIKKNRKIGKRMQIKKRKNGKKIDIKSPPQIEVEVDEEPKIIKIQAQDKVVVEEPKIVKVEQSKNVCEEPKIIKVKEPKTSTSISKNVLSLFDRYVK